MEYNGNIESVWSIEINFYKLCLILVILLKTVLQNYVFTNICFHYLLYTRIYYASTQDLSVIQFQDTTISKSTKPLYASTQDLSVIQISRDNHKQEHKNPSL